MKQKLSLKSLGPTEVERMRAGHGWYVPVSKWDADNRAEHFWELVDRCEDMRQRAEDSNASDYHAERIEKLDKRIDDILAADPYALAKSIAESLSYEDMHKAYVIEGKRINTIAEECGMAWATIYRRLVSLGIIESRATA